MSKIIFHHPGRIYSQGTRGSNVRPYQMLEAFRANGHQVDEVTGNINERRARVKKIKKNIKSGVKYDFVYSENRTIPFAMSEPHRLPVHPLFDHLFLNYCSKHAIPVSLFYRDIYWRDSSYSEMASWWLRLVTIPLYWYDWLWHCRYTRHLFLPSLAMKEILPGSDWKFSVSALPPGVNVADLEPRENPTKALRLLYVGGVTPPSYDLSPLFEVTEDLDFVRLVVCCRPDEWRQVSSQYPINQIENISIIHASGDQLRDLYAVCDISVIVRNNSEYLSFAAPVKLFEAIGYGVPLLVSGGTEAARIVAAEGLGWVVSTKEELVDQLEELYVNPELLREKRDFVARNSYRNSWTNRAREVAQIVMSNLPS